MKKITELTEMTWRTVHTRDEYGNLVRGTEDVEVYRSVKVVSTGIKFVHFMVDMICFQVVLYLVGYLFELLQNFTKFSASVNLTIGLVAAIFTLFLYPALYTLCEYKWQRTPAKFLTKAVVIDEYGNRPDLRTIILRSFIRWVPFDAISCLGEPSSGWHDRWSKTWVVPEEEYVELKRLQAEQQ
ncbi:MAG: RDD family protein [Chitinophagales bacterium]|nr:RDD family protein [Chitinophagales bacterium]